MLCKHIEQKMAPKSCEKKKMILKKIFFNEAFEVVQVCSEKFFYTKDKIDIAIPFTCNTLNRQERIVQLLGRMTYYKIQLLNSGITLPVHFKVLHENEEPEIKKLVKVVNELVKE